jgi:hypothetical protein
MSDSWYTDGKIGKEKYVKGHGWALTVEEVAAAYPELQRMGQAGPEMVGTLDCDIIGKGPLGESPFGNIVLHQD